LNKRRRAPKIFELLSQLAPTLIEVVERGPQITHDGQPPPHSLELALERRCTPIVALSLVPEEEIYDAKTALFGRCLNGNDFDR
jgi:hypothetical protein